MARTTREPALKIRTVKTKEDRKRPSVFMRLKADESFKGIALFEPDPELGENPGYLEYYDHYDKQGNTYVPCAGSNCPFCSANDNPSTRALTTWYFPDASDVKDQIKVFTMNYSTINDMTDEAEEEDGILGKSVRVKRLDDRGNYKVRVLSDKPLTKKQISDLLKRLEELFKDGLEGLVLTQLKRQIERLKAIAALDDDDDDDDDEPKAKATTTRTKRGKAVEEDEDDDEEDDEEEEDDDEPTAEEEDEEDDDEEEEEEDDEEDDDAEEEETEEEAEEIKAGVYEILRIKEQDETFDLQNDDGKVKMWLGDGVDVDYDVITKGVSVTIDASQDDEGDWIITAISLKKPPRTRTSRSTTTRKTSTRTTRKK